MNISGRFATAPTSLKLLMLLVYILVGVLVSATIMSVVLVVSGVDPSSFIAGDLSLGILKGMQMASTIGMIGVPGFLAMYTFGYKDAVSSVHALVAGAVILLGFSLLPVNEWLGVWNHGLTLPESLQGLENWIRSSEEQTAALVTQFLNMDGITDLLINLLVIAVAPAICEELLFRGALQRVFHERFDIHLAIIAAAVIFSSFHMQFLGFVPRFILGLVLGYLYAWSGKLFYPILLHFVNNATVVVLVYLLGPEMLETNEAAITAASPAGMFVLGIAISSGLLFYIYKQTEQLDTN